MRLCRLLTLAVLLACASADDEEARRKAVRMKTSRQLREILAEVAPDAQTAGLSKDDLRELAFEEDAVARWHAMSGAWSDRTDWLLPFDLRRRRLLGRWGRCCQAEGGTHVDELQHAVDYSVDERTPVIASRDGVVAAAVGDFTAARSRRFEMVRKLEPRLRVLCEQ